MTIGRPMTDPDRSLDLTKDPTDDRTPASDSRITTRFDHAKAMHEARQDLARRLFLLLVAVIVGGVLLVIAANLTERDTQQARDLFLNIFTPILTLVSSMVGYYYGTTGRNR
jgi:hypothetical protein